MSLKNHLGVPSFPLSSFRISENTFLIIKRPIRFISQNMQQTAIEERTATIIGGSKTIRLYSYCFIPSAQLVELTYKRTPQSYNSRNDLIWFCYIPGLSLNKRGLWLVDSWSRAPDQIQIVSRSGYNCKVVSSSTTARDQCMTKLKIVI